jgi:hypothetical protein
MVLLPDYQLRSLKPDGSSVSIQGLSDPGYRCLQCRLCRRREHHVWSALVRSLADNRFSPYLLRLAGSDEGPWNHSFRFEQCVFSAFAPSHIPLTALGPPASSVPVSRSSRSSTPRSTARPQSSQRSERRSCVPHTNTLASSRRSRTLSRT